MAERLRAAREGAAIAKGFKGAGAAAALVVLAYVLFRAVPHRTRISVLHEDGPVEYLGALSFFLAAAFFFLIYRELSRRRNGHSSALKPYVALVIAALFLLAGGEEISWGQRILGIETPDTLREANRQEEINLHNLSFSRFDEYRLFTLGWYPYMIGLPLLALARTRVRRLINRTLPLVPMAVWPFALLYLLNDGIAWVAGRSLLVDGGYDVKLDFPRVELRETLFAVLTASIAYLWWRAARRPSEADASPSRHWSEDGGASGAVAGDIKMESRRLARVASVLALLALSGCGGQDGAERPDSAASESAAVVWAVGDGADGSLDARSVAQLMSAEPYDRMLYLGDVYPDGTREDFEKNYRSVYGHMDERTSPTPGNHEWENREEGYEAYWEAAHGRDIEPWYSFDLGGWEFLSLNSEVPVEPGSPQHKWLQRELDEPGNCRIAFWHSPRFSASSEHHGDDPQMQPLWDALKGRAVMVLSGHDHDMQRFKPVDGITQFVSGAGGHFNYELDDDPRLAFGNDTDFGALRLKLRPGVAEHTFVTVAGEEVDRGTLRCKK